MAHRIEGFDYFLQQVAPDLRQLTGFAFDYLLDAYDHSMKELQPHMMEAARQRSSENEKARYIAALEQCLQLQPQMHNAFAFHLMEAFKVMSGQDAGTPSAEKILAELQARAEQGREDDNYLKKIAGKTLVFYADWLTTITDALQYTLGPRTVDQDNNPFNPLMICHALHASLKIIQIHSGIKTELYRLFEEQLLKRLTPFYQQLAQHLKEAGIPVTPPGETPTRDDHAIPVLSPADLVLDTIDSDFNAILDNGIVPDHYGNPDYQPMAQTGEDDADTITATDLSRFLASLQKGYDPHTDGELPAHIKNQLQLESDQGRQLLLSRHDENIINLLNLAFRQLAETQDESIAYLFFRLQVPYTRLCLSDELFFHDSHHPARILLDKLIALTFTSHDEDTLFKQVQHCVTKIGLRYRGENALFREMIPVVDHYIDSNETPFAESRQQMTLAFEQAEKRRMAREAAKQAVLQQTDKLGHKLRFHTLMEKFWQQLLGNIYLYDGPDSDNWQQGLYLLECLVTVSSDNDMTAFKGLTRNLAHIIKQVSRLFSEHDINPEWKRTFFDQLQEIQILLMRGKTLADIDDDELSHTFAIDMIIDDYDSEMVADIDTATIGHEHRRTADEPLIPDNKKPGREAAAAFIRQLKPGQWINILHDNKRTPCFLSYYSRFRQSYIFCDRHNNKLFERARDELLNDFVTGYASVLDKTVNFEATLATVMARLKNMP